ncbi:MAG: copper chaperone PCu(A)C [Alphaproteobacteria bacterium]|nr:copper chaperone PCu(A)C [Alphaproteobacteria bacterium SS10]
MISHFYAALLGAVMVLAVMPTLPQAADAHFHEVGDLTIDHPFARASASPAIKAGAAYLEITNEGEADRLVAATSPRAKKVELHTHELTAGVMRMREVAGGIELPAGETVTLKPGGLHIMLLGLTAPLVEGETFPMTLTFEQAGTVEVVVMVEGVQAGAHKHDHHDHGDDHDDQSDHNH